MIILILFLFYRKILVPCCFTIYIFFQILWLMHHHENPPLRQNKNKVQEDLVDRYLPEMLFYMEEIRGLIRKYSQVVQRYYVQYLSGYDAIALDQGIQNLNQLPEEDSIVISSICQTISR